MAEVRSDDSSKPIQTFLEKFKDEITEHHPALQGLKFDESKLTGLFRDYCDFREGDVPVWPPPVKECLQAFVPDSKLKQQLGVDQEFRRLVAGEIGEAVAEASKKPVDETDLSKIRTYYDTADWTLGEEIDQLEPDVQEAAAMFLDEVVRRDLDTRNIKNLLKQTKKPPWRVNPDIWRRTQPVLERIVGVYEHELQFEIEKGYAPDLLANRRRNFKDMVSLAQIDTPEQERLEAARRLAQTAIDSYDMNKLWVRLRRNLSCKCPKGSTKEGDRPLGNCLECRLNRLATENLDESVLRAYREKEEKFVEYAAFMEFLLPEAFLLAVAELKLPQTYRTPDSGWIKTPSGKKAKIAPGYYLLLVWFDWLRVKAVKVCHELITDQPLWKPDYPLKTDKIPTCPRCEADCVEQTSRAYVCPKCGLGIPADLAYPSNILYASPVELGVIASPVDFSGSQDALDHAVVPLEDEWGDLKDNIGGLKGKLTSDERADEADGTIEGGEAPFVGGGYVLDDVKTSPITDFHKQETREFAYGSTHMGRNALWQSYKPTPHPRFGFQFNPEQSFIQQERGFLNEILVLTSAGSTARHQELLEFVRENCNESIIQILELSVELPLSGEYRTKIAELLGKELQWVNHQVSAAKKVIGKALTKEDERKARVKELFLKGLEKGEKGYSCREIAAETGIDFSEVLSIVLRLCLKLDPPTARRLIEKITKAA